MSAETAKPLPLRIKLFNGSGAIAFGIKDNGFSVFLLTYYNLVLGMEAWLVSLALVIALIVDAFIDPFLGNLSDRTYTAWGRRLPWLYAAPIPLAFAWYFLWMPPVDGTPSFWTLLTLAIIVRLLLSACEVPSIALVPELTRDYEERTTLFRFRFLFGWGSGLVILWLAYGVFLINGPQSAEGYDSYALYGSVVMAIAVLVSAAGQHKWIARYPKDRPDPFGFKSAFHEIREAFSEKAFLIFAAGALAAYVSQGMTFALSNYLYIFVWQLSLSQLSYIYPIVLFLSVVLVFYALAGLHSRFGKAKTGAVATILSMTLWLVPYGLFHIGWWPELGTNAAAFTLFGFIFLSNAAGVAAVISATSMVAEVIEQFEQRTGRRAEGSFYAGNWLVQKSATGVGILLAGVMLSVSQFPTGSAPGDVAANILAALAAMYCAAIFVLGVASAFWLNRFPIDRAEHEARLAALNDTSQSDLDGSNTLP
ncbi:MFS transporter [Pontixanthobacter aquaemixtae]|uniref:Sugar transporter n=1 Tax=Pontixanthobacter aquaemixtae TaxID=1958940 RepID=A0A844ZXK1_9SPHN|nr:MFS transporter [Pontixanthobacter aquaemixtae]MXO91920.1 sugar transporter [Pontixanthobacter aquaemixtae]